MIDEKDLVTGAFDVATGAFDVVALNRAPEEVEMRFSTSGPRGGDAGHGATAELDIAIEGGAHSLIIDGRGFDPPPARITLLAQGDWEIAGLERAIVQLALNILQRRIDMS